MTISLPDSSDVALTEASIAAWAAAARLGFGRNRQDFNFAVCDALASAGLTPTANMVLKLGKWGTSSSVQADTREWYQSLSVRLKSLESNIPLAARRQANILLEQMFAVAQSAASENITQTLAKAVDPLKSEIDSLFEANKALTQKILEQSAKNEGLLKQISAEQVLARELQKAASALEVRLATVTKALETERSEAKENTKNLELKLEAALATAAAARQANAEQKAESAQELLAANRLADNERRRLMLASDAERVDSGRRLQQAHDEGAKVRADLESANLQKTRSAGETAIALASLEGVKALLASERERERERLSEQTEKLQHYQSDAFRFQALHDFVTQARHFGVSILASENDGSRVVVWLESGLGAGTQRAQMLMENFKMPSQAVAGRES